MFMQQPNRPVYLRIRQRLFPVVVDDYGQPYIPDPEGVFDRPHVALSRAGNGAPGLHGLGANRKNQSTAVAAASTAAMFIPVVGPAVSAAISIVGGKALSSDPVKLKTLDKQILSLRTTLRDLRNQLAGSTIDNFDPSNTSIDAISNEMLGSFVKRKVRWDKYRVINALNGWIAKYQEKVRDKNLVSAIKSAIIAK